MRETKGWRRGTAVAAHTKTAVDSSTPETRAATAKSPLGVIWTSARRLSGPPVRAKVAVCGSPAALGSSIMAFSFEAVESRHIVSGSWTAASGGCRFGAGAINPDPSQAEPSAA
jgi:hypothetical protein